MNSPIPADAPASAGAPAADGEVMAILAIAAPLALAQLAQMIMGITDAIWMGHIDTEALAAGGLGSSLGFMLLFVTSGVLQSIQPIVAQGRGAGDHRAFGRALAGGIVLAAALAVPIIAVLLCLAPLLIRVGDPPAIVELVRHYEMGFVWGVPAWLWQVALRNYLAAFGRIRVIMITAIVACFANFGLNWALIFGHLGLPALGLTGSGCATSIVCWGTAITITLYVVCCRLLPHDLFRLSWREIRAGIREVTRIGWPIAGIWAVEVGLFSGSMVVMARFGPVALAAHEICVNLCGLTYMVPFAIGTAATVRVGYNIGAGIPGRARRAGFMAIAMGALFMLAAAILMRLFAGTIFHFYIGPADPMLPDVSRLGVSLLGLAAIFQVFDGTQTVAAGALRGLRDTRVALVAGIAGYWLIGGPVGLALAFGMGFGPIGIWWGFLLGLIVVAILLTWRFAALSASLSHSERTQATPPGWPTAETMPRLDAMLVARGLVATRSRARAITVAGMVRVDGMAESRPGRMLADNAALEVDSRAGTEWVSRGAIKLIAALDHFRIDPGGSIALDIGASTGGFTQVLLQRGAARVYAVDVGHGQLAPALRADPRVVVLEHTNARDLTDIDVPEPVDLVTCDASFISLQTILPAPLRLTAATAALIALIKPQFEVGPAGIGKGGIVRDPALRQSACDRIRHWIETSEPWRVQGVIDSPIQGGDGNTEFLLCARRG